MKGIRTCPYCDGEVEVIRLANDKHGRKTYRIECWRCKRTVGRGFKFDNESDEEGKERIRQYEKILDAQKGITK